MTKRIVDTGPKMKTIHDTGPTLPRVDPAQVAAALGAEPCEAVLEGPFGPITRFAIRQEMYRRLQAKAAGKLPHEVDYGPLISIPPKTWTKLEELAAEVALPDFAPSAGQMAAILLSMTVRALDKKDTAKSRG